MLRSGKILFSVDRVRTEGDQMSSVGWSYHIDLGVIPVRIIYNGQISDAINIPRIDVSIAHNRDDILACGWMFKYPSDAYPEYQVLIDNVWTTFYKTPNEFMPMLSRSPPSYLVVDNFYDNPDSVREFALKKEFNFHPDYHKGKRTDERYLFPGLREKFEQLVGRKITKWFEHGVNGVFQYCIENDPIVYHCDYQNYA